MEQSQCRVEQSQNSVTVLSSQEDFEWAIRTVHKDKDDDMKSAIRRVRSLWDLIVADYVALLLQLMFIKLLVGVIRGGYRSDNFSTSQYIIINCLSLSATYLALFCACGSAAKHSSNRIRFALRLLINIVYSLFLILSYLLFDSYVLVF